MLADTDTPVPVDNYLPEVDPEDVAVTFEDNDYNGICDIGDDVTVTVDMTGAPGGPIAGVYANLYDWGHPSQDMVPLTPGSPIYSITFTVLANPGDFCSNQADGGVGFEDDAASHNCGKAPTLMVTPAPSVEVVAKDASDNWSDYDWTGAPSDMTLLASTPTPVHVPYVQAWPFVYLYELFGPLTDILADTDAPDPVNPTFPYPSIPASGVQSEPLQDGRIGIQLFYRTMPRNQDVKEFYVYGDYAEAGVIDWNTFLGEPIAAGTVPTTVTLGGNHEWISDVLPERETPYHFAVLAVDNAGNWSDKDLTWITGISSDATAPTATLEAAFREDLPCIEDNQPTSIGGGNVDFIGRLDEASEYINVVYVELYGRVKDLDPTTEGYQPGLWSLLDEEGIFPSSTTLEGPYVFADGVLPAAFDITHCETFELVLVPWDEAGNHLTPDECAIFDYTYDPFVPVVTMFAINGNPSPYDMELANSALVEITATDECDMTGELTYWLYVSRMGDETFLTWPLLTRQTLAVGEPFSYQWDLMNYPAGHAQLELYVCDDAGHYTTHFKRVVVIDQSAPDGVFASYRRAYEMISEGSHPYYTRLLDGQSIGGDEFTRTWFWVEWPDPIPFTAYDVDYVKMEYQMAGSLNGWTTIGIETAYDDSVSWEGSEWAGYEFMWDTRGFSDGDQITLRATVMDNVGNETVQTVTVTVAADAPILALAIPEAQDVCGENRIKGIFNIIGTEITNPIDTYYVSYIIKKHDYPDLGDCNPLNDDGWIWAADTLMIEGGTTQETIWRGKVNPDSAFMGFSGQTPVYGMPDGAYDIALVTTDVAGNWSWDKNDDWCVDAGYFAYAVANGMGMTVVLQNEAPEVRIRTVNTFGSVDEPWPWPQPVYVQAGDAATVTSWTESTCDVAKVEYWLADTDTSNHVVLDEIRLVGVSTSPDDYAATFPSSGGVGQYLVPGALQHGYVVVDLIAKLTDVLGNESFFYAPMWILDISPASVMITNPAPGSYVRHEVALESDALADDEIYSVTYYYRAVGSGTWIPIATTMPHDGDKWNTDTNGNTIYWNTDLLPAGCNQYELAAIAKDADLVDDPEPPVIRVYVDNTAPAVTMLAPDPMVVNSTASWIGGPMVELTATASDACGIRYVRFWEKLAEEHFDDVDLLFQDAEAPWAFTWQGETFTSKLSGWYNLVAEAEDMAGNVTYSVVTVYIDQWAPEGWITQINSDQTPDGSNFYGVLAITGWCKDDVPMNQVANQKYDSGLAGAQFQYRQFVQNGGDLPLSDPRDNPWIDLGGIVSGSGPTYVINWDTGTLVPGTYELRIVGIDNVNNRADVDGTPMLAYVCIDIVDMAAPKAIIAGVDKVSGTIWATTETHGQEDISFVRFEYKPASALETAAWTVIGTVDGESDASLYGTLWHYAALPNGNYLVRAVAYDDDYDVVEFPDLYDKSPATMMVTINNTTFEVTMAPTAQITSLDRWGNLADYDELMAKAVCAAGKPTVIVVYDDDPEDHYNTPWATQLELERPDDQTVWVDGFSTDSLGDWGIVTIIGTYNNFGVVGAKTSTLKLFKVTDNEGTKGVVSQDGMAVNIPPGASENASEGLIVVKVHTPAADPEIDEIIPVSQTVMMKYVDHEEGFRFDNGLKATVTLDYTPGMIPQGIAEGNLRAARWCEEDREWAIWSISNVVVDQINNKVTFLTTVSGAYAVVAASTLRITEPIYLPGCDGYTGRWPQMFSTIEDILFDVDEDDILVVIDGPAGNKIFDNVRIYDNGHVADGFEATYDCVSNNLYMALDPTWDWESYYERLGVIWDGLPAGTYTVTITAMNEVGDKKTVTDTFMVDAVKPTVNFAGTYVAPNPSFVINVADHQSGIDPETIFLDIYSTQYCFLGTATPTGMTYDDEAGTVTFDQMTFDQTLGDGMSIDVVVYDANQQLDCTGESEIDFCDCCRSYCPGQGIADCAGNHANPMWRRYTVDGVPPTAALVDTLYESQDGECGGDITVAIRDVTSGINPEAFEVTIIGGTMASEGWEFEPTDVSGGIIHGGDLTFSVDCICAGITEMDIKVKSVDMVGNYKLTTDEVTFVCEEEDLTISGLMSYPNPFDPYAGEKATISIDLSKQADVTVKIFDFAGEPVRTLVADDAGPGVFEDITWDGTDESGNIVATGAYIANIKIDDGQKVISKNIKIGVAKRSND
ncbi:MAG: FlgD immunoglobulin-like domain containing protein [bacterium]